MLKILVIVGEAGVGKDTAATYLSEKNKWNIIHSYTNRPMREGETQGKEHIFVNHPSPNDTFAYTKYGNYDYWTELNQFKENIPNIYVIDEAGLLDVHKKAMEIGNIKIMSIYISTSKEKRSERGVSENRMNRDETRLQYDCKYDFNITNNGNLTDFYASLDNVKL